MSDKKRRKIPKSPIVGIIGENVRTIRKGQNLKSAELAKAIGCHEATITKYESGMVNFPIETLEKLAKGLGVSIYDLLERSKDSKKEE